MSLRILPLSAARLPDLDSIFLARGCSAARRCYCLYYRLSSRDYRALGGGSDPAGVRAALAERADATPPPGLIAYAGDTPVGWISLGPRRDFARLRNSPTMRAIDEQPVWSIVCFVIPSAHRGQGIARQLLAATLPFARAHGAQWLEAYPVDRAAPNAPDAPWFGSLSLFRAAGFREVARHRPGRPIVRLSLTTDANHDRAD